MPFLFNSDLSFFFYILFILYSIYLPLNMKNWHVTLGLDIKNGWYSPSNLRRNSVAKELLKLEWLKHLKFTPSFDETYWNQMKALAYHLIFYFRVLNQLQMYFSIVAISSSRMSWYEWIEIRGIDSTHLIWHPMHIFLLSWLIVSIYVRHAFVTAPPITQMNMYHHHFLS